MSLDKPQIKLKKATSSRKRGKRFVVQEHLATTRHWDLRLEINGMMWSWALPKGPSLNPKKRRLAVETKPHTLPYSNFEGIIAPGLYGAGQVMQWDVGTFTTEEDLGKALEKGIINFELKGRKLRGKWALIKIKEGWLLIKKKDEYAKEHYDIIKREPKSVKSDKLVGEITRKDGFISEKESLGFEEERRFV
jgi:bifunctional non-homologous end joining protein LigD